MKQSKIYETSSFQEFKQALLIALDCPRRKPVWIKAKNIEYARKILSDIQELGDFPYIEDRLFDIIETSIKRNNGNNVKQGLNEPPMWDIDNQAINPQAEF